MNKKLKSFFDFVNNFSGKIFVFILFFFIIFWYSIATNFITKIPNSYIYKADIVSVDNFYNQANESFDREKYSITNYSFTVEGVNKIILNIKATFEVKSIDGIQIFKVEPLYGINSITHKHAKGYGDKDRQGYFFAPKFLNKNQEFLFWHVSDDKPSLMKYDSTEYINGLKLYKYKKAQIETIDQSDSLSFLPDVPEKNGVKLVSDLILWIEPISGHVVNLEDYSVDYYYYDIKTGQKLSPYNKFSNKFSEQSIIDHVQMAKNEKIAFLVVYIVIPILFLLLLIFISFKRNIFIEKINNFIYKNILIILIILIGCTLTILLYLYIDKTIKEKRFNYLNSEVNDAINKVQEKMDIYGTILLGGRALFNASSEVSRDEWKAYVSSIELEKKYPGNLGLGYLKFTSNLNKENLIESVREEGFIDFNIFPNREGDFFTPVVYFEPFNEINKKAFGYDMYSDSVRRSAIETAIETSQIAITEKLKLITNTESSNQTGFLAYLAVYKNGVLPTSTEERNKKAIGAIYSSFRMSEFIENTLVDIHNNLDINIFSGLSTNPMNLVYSAEGLEKKDEQIFFHQTKTIYIYNHPWTFEFYNSSDFKDDKFDKFILLAIPFTGFFFTLLASLVALSITNSQKRAVDYADKMNKDLVGTLKIIEKNAIELSKFEMAVENAYDHILITDPEGIILYANNSVKRITGFDKSEILGKKAGARELWGGLMEEKFYKKMWNTIKVEKKTFFGEVKNKRKNGEEYYAFASISPVLGKNRDIVYFIGIERDITKEKEVDKAKSEFVSLASHQLKTPLSAIKWYSEILLEETYGKLNAEQKKYLQEIETGNERMIDLINSLLNTSNLELGTFTLENERINLMENTEMIINEIIPKYKNKNIQIVKSFSDELTEFKGDKKKLCIVLQNLISNALKYSKKDSIIEIELKIIKRGELFGEKKISQKSFGIKISDSGIGIPENQQEEIFKKMFRAQNARSIETDGNGLGLYIVKSIIEKSNGSIWFISKENSGTSFFVTYPIAGMKVKKDNL